MIRKKGKFKYDYIIFIIILFWMCLSLLRTFFNFSKTILEELSWINISTESKKERLFGDEYKLFSSLNKDLSQESNILLYSYDSFPYYYGRYVIYPHRLEHVTSLKLFRSTITVRSYDFIILYKLTTSDGNNSLKTIQELNIKPEKIKIYE